MSRKLKSVPTDAVAAFVWRRLLVAVPWAIESRSGPIPRRNGWRSLRGVGPWVRHSMPGYRMKRGDIRVWVPLYATPLLSTGSDSGGFAKPSATIAIARADRRGGLIARRICFGSDRV